MTGGDPSFSPSGGNPNDPTPTTTVQDDEPRQPTGAPPNNDQPADPKPDPGKANINLSRSGEDFKGASTTQTDEPGAKLHPALDSEGRVLGGRFDSDDFKFTQDWLDQNPAASKLVEAYHNLEREYSHVKNGKLDGLGVDPQVLASLDLSLNEKGEFSNDVKRALMGKVITPEVMGELKSMVGDLMNYRAQDVERWKSSLDLSGAVFDDVIDWAKSNDSGYTDEQLAKFQNQLNDPDTRDLRIRAMAQDYMNKTGGATDMFRNAPPKTEAGLDASNTSGPGAPSSGGQFGTFNEYMAALAACNGDARAEEVVHQKAMRSPACVNWAAQRAGGRNEYET